jgi:hypothetical protein
MSTRTFLSLATRLAASVPGCPQPILEQHIRDSAIDTCERTLAWRYQQPSIRLTPGVYEYPYNNPTQTEVHAFLTATVNGAPLSPLTLEQLYDTYPQWPNLDVNQRSTPQYICQLDPDSFVLAPLPDDSVAYDLRMIAVLKPLRTSTGMDKTIFDDLENVIMHGALQHLLVMPNKNWSDRELATYHAKQYLSKITERRARANLGAARASMSVQMRPLA